MLDIGLQNGSFSPETPPEFSVPDGVPVVLRFAIEDGDGYAVEIIGPAGKSMPVEFDSAGTRDVEFESIDAGETVRVKLAGDELKIVGGVEVGP